MRGGGTGNHLLDKFFAQGGPYYQRAYLVRLWDAMHEKYTTDLYEKKIQYFRDLLWDEQLEDFAEWGRTSPTANDPSAPAEFDPNLDRVRTHIRVRRNYLVNYLRNTEKFTGHDRVKITEIMYNPPGPDDLEFLELWNNSGKAIDVSGWTIEGIGSSDPSDESMSFVFPPGSMLVTDEVIIVAKDPQAFNERYGAVARVFGPYTGQLSNSGEMIKIKDDGPNYPATIDLVRYDDEPPWPGRPDGLGYSLELMEVFDDLDNDPPENWRASLGKGGSPGYIHRQGESTPFFTRGNCNGDGVVDISDAVATLRYLFSGADEPPCLDGCDVNGDENVSIADAIALLQYLFLPDGFTIPAPAPGECLPAREGFCNRTNCVTAP